jgi:hypothetical protein
MFLKGTQMNADDNFNVLNDDDIEILSSEFRKRFESLTFEREFHNPRKKRTLVGGGISVAAAISIAIALSLSGTTQAAAWSPEPTSLSETQQSTITSECGKFLIAQGGQLGLPPMTGYDFRGRYGFTTYTDGQISMLCSFSRDGDSFSITNLADISGISLSPLPFGTLSKIVTFVVDTRTSVVTLTGNIFPGATRVDIVFADGSIAHASLFGGKYAAWWPKDQPASELRQFDSAGNLMTTAPLGN